ncbi:MAG: tRNA pseudouridine(38-40) synthase TruA [Clostridiales bacterium]|nr:tRNA pseudouridine(38-40) synthase TruA [Clostridiales bacterium]
MSNIRLTLRYDGTKYFGFQRQKDKPTIQKKLEECLNRILEEDIEVIGSGRTDAGVHALAHTVNFHTKTDKTPKEIMAALNAHLPWDIAVTEAKYASERFHSRYNVLRKTYVYRINTRGYINVFERKYVYDFFTPLDSEKMRAAAKLMTGTHDFKGFSAVKKTDKSTVRTVFSIDITEKEGETDITYTGSGFLRNMVRIMTGTLIEIGSGQKEASVINEVFETKDRLKAGFTAPAQGLTMVGAEY